MKVLCNKCNHIITSQNFKRHHSICNGKGPRIRNLEKGKDWAKGKTYDEIYGKEKSAVIRAKQSANSNSSHPHSEDTKKRISEKMKGNTNWKNSVHKSGRGKKGYHEGYYYMSSWELAYIIYSIDHSIKIKRVWEQFNYKFEGVDRQYIPDFYLEDEECYVEIKGYCNTQWESKLEAFPHPIKVLYKKEIQPYLKYVIENYGPDILEK